jgi:hypothetical protein
MAQCAGMKNVGAFIIFLIAIFSCSDAGEEPAMEQDPSSASVAYQWGKVALEATANDTERFRPRPYCNLAYARSYLDSSFRCVDKI